MTFNSAHSDKKFDRSVSRSENSSHKTKIQILTENIILNNKNNLNFLVNFNVDKRLVLPTDGEF